MFSPCSESLKRFNFNLPQHLRYHVQFSSDVTHYTIQETAISRRKTSRKIRNASICNVSNNIT